MTYYKRIKLCNLYMNKIKFISHFSTTTTFSVDKNKIIKKALELKEEATDLTQDKDSAIKHMAALRKLEKTKN